MTSLCTKCSNLSNLDGTFDEDGREIYSRDDIQAWHPYGNFESIRQRDHNGCQLCRSICKGLESTAPLIWLEAMATICIALEAKLMYFRCFYEQSPGLQSQQRYFDLKIPLSTRTSDPLHTIFPECTVDIDPLADKGIGLASLWLKECLEGHSNCSNEVFSLPTRVIDVGVDGQEPCLHITNGERHRWVTLSHCWGKVKTLRTLKDNLNSHCDEIAMKTLPKTYRDAIFITRNLGFRYLWIDSLCIIQDCQADWEAEAGQMARVYRHATINIAAQESEDDSCGIFDPIIKRRLKAPSLAIPCQSVRRNISGVVYATPRQVPATPPAPLQKRAWVLQECLLATRVLHYFHMGVEWECQSASAIESGRNFEEKLDRGVSFSQAPHKPRLPLPPFRDLDHTPQGELLRLWYETINRCCRREITFIKDILPAVAGLARALQDNIDSEYTEGIWLQDFHRALLWSGNPSSQGSEHWPSWSWAVGCPYPRSLTPYDPSIMERHGRSYLAEFVSMKHIPHGSSGKRPRLELRVRGWTQRVKKAAEIAPYKYNGMQHVFNVQGPGLSFGPVVIKLRIGDFGYEDMMETGKMTWYACSLVLERTDDEEEIYRRVWMHSERLGEEPSTENLIGGHELRTVRIV